MRAGLGLTAARAPEVLHAPAVTTRKQGTRVYYSLASDDVARLYAEVRESAAACWLRWSPPGRHTCEDVEQISREELLAPPAPADHRARRPPATEYTAGTSRGAVSPHRQLEQRLAELPSSGESSPYFARPLLRLRHDACACAGQRRTGAGWTARDARMAAGRPPRRASDAA